MLYHYTRITRAELAHIKKHGLLPLSEDVFLLKEKVLQDRGINVNLNRSSLEPEHERVGKVCFVTKSYIEDEEFDMVEQLCRFWGGEAISDWCSSDEWYEDILKDSYPVEIGFDIPTAPLYTTWGDEVKLPDGEGYTTVCIGPEYIRSIKEIKLQGED